MKIFDLMCLAGHRFEGWFGSAEDFASQKTRGLIECPSCGALDVDRVPSATRFNTGAAQPPVPAQAGQQDPMALAQKLYSRMLDELLTRSEDVGSEFPAEARRIHYQEAPARMIRGQASAQEHDELVDEGIPVARLAIPPTDRWS